MEDLPEKRKEEQEHHTLHRCYAILAKSCRYHTVVVLLINNTVKCCSHSSEPSIYQTNAD